MFGGSEVRHSLSKTSVRAPRLRLPSEPLPVGEGGWMDGGGKDQHTTKSVLVLRVQEISLFDLETECRWEIGKISLLPNKIISITEIRFNDVENSDIISKFIMISLGSSHIGWRMGPSSGVRTLPTDGIV